MTCSLELIVSASLHTLLALPVNSIANVTLSSSKQMLAEVKRSYFVLFHFLHPYLLVEIKGVLAVLGEGDSIKVPGTDPSLWELI